MLFEIIVFQLLYDICGIIVFLLIICEFELADSLIGWLAAPTTLLLLEMMVFQYVYIYSNKKKNLGWRVGSGHLGVALISSSDLELLISSC